jgi:hypothetical protein
LRRLAGISLLLVSALSYSPAVPPDISISQPLIDALLIPAFAAAGVWLVLPNPVLLGFCIFMLAVAHSRPGSGEAIEGYLYPTLAAVAALWSLWALRSRSVNDKKNT